MTDTIKLNINFDSSNKVIVAKWISPSGKEYEAFSSAGDSYGISGELELSPSVSYFEEFPIDSILKIFNIEKRCTYEQVIRAVKEAYVRGVFEE